VAASVAPAAAFRDEKMMMVLAAAAANVHNSMKTSVPMAVVSQHGESPAVRMQHQQHLTIRQPTPQEEIESAFAIRPAAKFVNGGHSVPMPSFMHVDEEDGGFEEPSLHQHQHDHHDHHMMATHSVLLPRPPHLERVRSEGSLMNVSAAASVTPVGPSKLDYFSNTRLKNARNMRPMHVQPVH